jgi:hypothetical protein
VYYSKFWATHKIQSPCPSVLITVDNSTLTIGGGVILPSETLCERYKALCLEFIPFDHAHRCEVAAFVFALRKAVDRLFKYYTDLDTTQQSDPAADGFPYLRDFCDTDDEDTVTCSGQIEYISRIGRTLTFNANLDPHTLVPTSEISSVIIKFTRLYSIDAHMNCTLAPKIVYWNWLPGGWIVIIMHKVAGEMFHIWKPSHPKQSISKVRAKVKASLKELHAAGFVHGDIRPNNIMVQPDNSVRIIDFEWAGKIGEATYPLFMNHVDVDWPAGATDGGKIMAEHDLQMCAKL